MSICRLISAFPVCIWPQTHFPIWFPCDVNNASNTDAVCWGAVLSECVVSSSISWGFFLISDHELPGSYLLEAEFSTWVSLSHNQHLHMTKRLALWVKFSADDILKYFSYFSQKTGFDISCKLSPLETICMKCQILFWGKIRKISPICRLLNMPREWWGLNSVERDVNHQINVIIRHFCQNVYGIFLDADFCTGVICKNN